MLSVRRQPRPQYTGKNKARCSDVCAALLSEWRKHEAKRPHASHSALQGKLEAFDNTVLVNGQTPPIGLEQPAHQEAVSLDGRVKHILRAQMLQFSTGLQHVPETSHVAVMHVVLYMVLVPTDQKRWRHGCRFSTRILEWIGKKTWCASIFLP